MNFTFESLTESTNAIDRLRTFHQRMLKGGFPEGLDPEISVATEAAASGYTAALANDLNTAEARAAIFDLVRAANSAADAGTLRSGNVTEILKVLALFDGVFAVLEDNDAAITRAALAWAETEGRIGEADPSLVATLALGIGGLAPGAAVKLNVLHKGQDKVVNLTLGQLPNTVEAKADTDNSDKPSVNKATDVPKLGMTVAPANSVAGAGKDGVVVTEVDPKSAAAERGFKEGDVILEVAGKSVTTAGDVRDAINAARTDSKNSVLMRVKSGGSSRFVAVPLAKG